MMFGLSDYVIEKIQNALAENAKVDKAIVFGSRAKGNYKEGSDIDIAIIGMDLNFGDTLSLHQNFDDLNIPYKIDLINYHTINEPDLKSHIDRVGIELYSRWKEYKILELGKVVTGNTPSSRFPEEFGNEMPFVTPTDYKNYNKWIYSADRFLSAQGISKLKNRILPDNSVLVTCIGSDMGKVALNKVPVVTNQQINSIIINQKVNSDFLYYKLIDSYDILRTYGEAGTAVPIVNKGDFEKIEITIPTDLKEQTAIASILSSLDDKIDLLHRQNKTLEQLAETLFRQWFVEEAEESWEETTLGEIADIKAGGDKPKFYSENKTEECTIPIYSNGIDNDGLYGYTNTAKINDESITVSARGTIGFVCLRQEPYVPIVRLISIIPKSNNVSSKYLYLWAKAQNISGTGTTQEQLTVPDFSGTTLLLPPLDKIKEFTDCVNEYFDKIKFNKSQIRTLTQTRDTLLPKLMSGEVRINL